MSNSHPASNPLNLAYVFRLLPLSVSGRLAFELAVFGRPGSTGRPKSLVPSESSAAPLSAIIAKKHIHEQHFIFSVPGQHYFYYSITKVSTKAGVMKRSQNGLIKISCV